MIDDDDDGPRGDEITLVLTRMQQLPKNSPEYLRVQGIWLRAAFSGGLRENFPPGTEVIAAEWDRLVRECRAVLV